MFTGILILICISKMFPTFGKITEFSFRQHTLAVYFIHFFHSVCNRLRRISGTCPENKNLKIFNILFLLRQKKKNKPQKTNNKQPVFIIRLKHETINVLDSSTNTPICA